MITFLLIIKAYLIGSIPWGYLLCRIFRKIDIRKYGSGNIGATNVYRNAGGVLALSVLLLDISKGLIPVLIAKQIISEPLHLLLVGIASVAGHNFSLFLKGKGGKGVSTSFGAAIGLFPIPAMVGLFIWITVLLITRYVSVGAIISAISLPLLIWVFHKDLFFTAAGVAICILIVYAHRKNIENLREGKEEKAKLPWKKR